MKNSSANKDCAACEDDLGLKNRRGIHPGGRIKNRTATSLSDQAKPTPSRVEGGVQDFYAALQGEQKHSQSGGPVIRIAVVGLNLLNGETHPLRAGLVDCFARRGNWQIAQLEDVSICLS